MAFDAEPDEPPDIDRLLGHLDHPVPALRADDIIARSAPEKRRLRMAAGIFLALVIGGAAYAVPSPLSQWLHQLIRPEPAPVDPRSAAVPASVQDDGGGIAIVPGQALLITFSHPQTAGEALVTLTESPEVTVRATRPGPTFTSGPDRLVIENPDATASYRIEIPRAAPRVEIRVRELPVFLKVGDRITVDSSMVRPEGYLIPVR